MRTDDRARRIATGFFLAGLIAAPLLRAEPPVPEVLEPAALSDVQPSRLDEAPADSGWPLDETVFTDVEAFTVPAVPIALPEDQAEE